MLLVAILHKHPPHACSGTVQRQVQHQVLPYPTLLWPHCELGDSSVRTIRHSPGWTKAHTADLVVFTFKDNLLPVWHVKLAIAVGGLEGSTRECNATDCVEQQEPRVPPLWQ